MRLLRFIPLLGLVLFVVTSASAQSDMAAQLGIQIDTHVEMAGFPTTGSQAQALRDQIAENLSTEINSVTEQIGELEGGSSVGREWVEAVDAAAEANTPSTAAEQFESYRHSAQIDAVTGNDTRPTLPELPPPGEIDGQINQITTRVTDAVRDIFRSEDGSALPTYHPAENSSAPTQLQQLMQQYGHEIAAAAGTSGAVGSSATRPQ